MKLVKQKKLFFTEGNSDKVYEVDLCEIDDLFVVNFRYGRRGNNLREGTKTVFPVSYEEAEKIYNKLIVSKEKKGYKDTIEVPETAELQEDVNSVQRDTILKYLNQALEGTYTRNWRVSKIIARVGALNFKEAMPTVAKFIHSKDSFEQYYSILNLIYFSDSSHVKDVLELFKIYKFETIVGRAAVAYVIKFGNKTQIDAIKSHLDGLISEGDISNLAVKFINAKPKDATLLYFAYLVSVIQGSYNKDLYNILQHVEFKANVFKSVRYIYRTAYLLNDISVFALISKRMAMSKPGFTSEFVHDGKDWIYASQELKKPNSSVAFSSKTKQYFINDNYKKLYLSGERDKNGFLQLAKAMLCSLDDNYDDAKQRIDYHYEYNEQTKRYNYANKYFPKYHQFKGIMYIVYGNSERFANNKGMWFDSSENHQSKREEVFPELWNNSPKEVIEILVNSKSQVATAFALNILNEKPEFYELLTPSDVILLLQKEDQQIVEVVLNYIKTKYSISKPNEELVISLFKSKNQKAIDLAINWFNKFKLDYVKSKSFTIGLVLSNELRAIEVLTSNVNAFSKQNFEISIEDVLGLFENPQLFTPHFLQAVSELVGNTTFGKLIKGLKNSFIIQLSKSAVDSNKVFAVSFSKIALESTYDLFKDSYADYICSDNPFLRQAGIEVLSQFPDSFLIENKEDLILFSFSEFQEIRKAIIPTLTRLITVDREIKTRLQRQLIFQLTEAETYEGLHEDCYETLKELFGRSLANLSKEDIVFLVLSKYEFAQKLGTSVFDKRIALSSLDVQTLVSLSKSDVLEIRNKLKTYFENNVVRISYELDSAIHVFNTSWDDVVTWACDYFEQRIDKNKWSAETLIYICDHINETVQQFGRRMITQYFTNEKGLPILLKLQEHPDKDMKFFVSNYLNNYAKDNVEVILNLEAYFTSILFNINSHRSSKTRVYKFLESESLKHKEVALLTVKILSLIMGSKTLTDRDEVLDIFLKLKETYEDLNIPLSIKMIS